MPAPSVSVVIPSYNHADYLGEAIDSVRAQSLADWELVIVDDGSADDSLAIARGYAERDPRIRVHAQANAGSHAAMNRGVRLAEGACVAILNSDDRFHPRRLERLLSVAEAGADLVVTGVRLIDRQGEPIADPEHWWRRMYAGFLEDHAANGAFTALARGNFTVSTSNFFFRRSLFEAVGPFRHLRYVIDWDWAWRALLHAPERFVFLADEALLDYRIHERNTILSNSLRAAAETASVHWRVLRARAPELTAALAAQRRRERFLRREAIAVRQAELAAQVAARDQALDELREQLAARERERDAAVQALENERRAWEVERRAIHASRTWRLGRAILAPARGLRRLLR